VAPEVSCYGLSAVRARHGLREDLQIDRLVRCTRSVFRDHNGSRLLAETGLVRGKAPLPLLRPEFAMHLTNSLTKMGEILASYSSSSKSRKGLQISTRLIPVLKRLYSPKVSRFASAPLSRPTRRGTHKKGPANRATEKLEGPRQGGPRRSRGRPGCAFDATRVVPIGRTRRRGRVGLRCYHRVRHFLSSTGSWEFALQCRYMPAGEQRVAV